MERKRIDISREELGRGLLHYNLLKKIENEEIYADKLLYDTLLQRLGVGESYFEHYVLDQDHEMQTIRTNLIEKIYTGEDITKDIEIYKSLVDFDSNLHVQFLEYTELLKYELVEYDIKFLLKHYEKVINITVPNFLKKNFNNLFLSDIEVYLISKYALHLMEFDVNIGFDFTKKFINYFTNSTSLGQEKIRCYSILVLKQCEIYTKEYEYKKALILAENCIEILRKSEIYTNLLSLINLKIRILVATKSDDEELEKLKSWSVVLHNLYKEYDVNPDDNKDFNINLFSWKNYHIISDVIKQRRMMCGFSQEKLAEGICDVKTISRIENKRTKIHPKNAEKLLAKLGLTGELCSDNIVTNNVETYKLCMKTTKLMSKNEYAQVEKNLKIIEKKLDLINKINLQYFRHKEVLLKKNTNLMSDEEFIDEAKKILNITLSINYLDKKLAIHLTKKEFFLLCNIMDSLEKIKRYDEMYEYIDILDNYFRKTGYEKIFFDMYSFYYNRKQSALGNIGEFDKSNAIIDEIIKKDFINQCHKEIIELAFTKTWNVKEQSIANSNKQRLYAKDKKIYMKSLQTPYILAEIFYYKFAIEFIDNEIKNL